jgi:hypothetical protein
MIHSIGATFRRLAVTRWMVFAIAALASLSIVLPPISTVAQAPMDPRNSMPVAPAQPAIQQAEQRTAAIILVKNALLAVNQGNLTGNYTVLRDLSSPGFREKNSAADLAVIFQGIRQQKFDLSSIVVMDPVLNQPRISADGQLALDGYFSSQQMRINFQLAFQKSNAGAWMIHGVSLNAAPETVAAVPIERR